MSDEQKYVRVPVDAIKQLVNAHKWLRKAQGVNTGEAAVAAESVHKIIEQDFYSLAAAPPQDDKLALCYWSEDEDGAWETGCGGIWEFFDDGPKENGVAYCYKCGRPVQLEPYTEQSVDDDELTVHRETARSDWDVSMRIVVDAANRTVIALQEISLAITNAFLEADLKRLKEHDHDDV